MFLRTRNTATRNTADPDCVCSLILRNVQAHLRTDNLNGCSLMAGEVAGAWWEYALIKKKLMKAIALTISSSQRADRLVVVVVSAVAWRNSLF